ncbi:U4 protein [Faba bean necrotic yellows virus]|uniref:U4 protein n=1 Tax=Faba bean necrotic yellows virus TaxID=59817 RepID=D2WHU1_9VIRU|nr:U4 protein [Faba bean necrotic yellows virus]
MEVRLLFFLLLIVVVINPSLVVNMVFGYMMGLLLRNNYSRLKAMMRSNKTEEEGCRHDAVDVSNPFEDVDTDVMQHLKRLGLDSKVDEEDVEYFRRFWQSMIRNK